MPNGFDPGLSLPIPCLIETINDARDVHSENYIYTECNIM
jgi:hypothetical protein